MAHDTILAQEPTTVRSGDSIAWDRADADHPPSDGWSLKYVLHSGPARYEFTATGAVDHFEIRLSSAATPFAPGLYRLSAFVEKSGDRHTIYDGELTVAKNPLSSVQTFAEQMVAKFEAELLAEGTRSLTLTSWQQGQRSEQYRARDEILRDLGHWREQVRRERGGALIESVPVGFSGAR